jgi:hypothetical protein
MDVSDMPASHPSNNVVEFGRPDGHGTAGRVFNAFRTVVQQRLSALADALYGNVDDALFDLSERSASSTHQARFFDGMREIRKKRQRAHAIWLDLVGRHVTALERNEPPRTRRNATRPKEDLSLVDEAELEENLAIEAMSDKATVRLNRALYALEQRLTQLLGGRLVDADNNPVGPRLLSDAFGQSLDEFDLEVEVKLIVLKLFERHVLGALDGVYDEMNALLVQAGVMPELRYQLPGRRAPGYGAGSPPHGVPQTNAGADHRTAPLPPESAGPGTLFQPQAEDLQIQSLLGELTQLLNARRGTPVPQAPPDNPGSPMAMAAASTASATLPPPSPREMLNALSLLQVELAASQAAAQAPSASAIKDALRDQIGALSGGQRPTALGNSEDMIDIVGMIFDYAVQDRNLPAPVSALLGRLQIPYLKVALLDRSFIAHHDHPARKLLDGMAQASIGWTEESDRDGRLIGQIRSIVERLNRDFEDDVGIFRRLLDEFHAFLDSNRKRTEISERRAAEAARGREKLDAAQRAAAQAIMLRIAGRELPVSVREILTRRWSNFLVLTHLRQGEESQEWEQATRFVEDIAWSVTPKPDEADRQRLVVLRPDLEGQFRRGMQSLGLHPDATEDMWREFDRIHGTLLVSPDAMDGATPAVRGEVVRPDEVTVRFASTRPGEEVVFSREDLEPDQQERLDSEAIDAWLEMARTLKAGTWMEFVKDDGTRERAKLLWISTIRALYLFVNRNGVKIAEKTANELAAELKEQRAVILEQVALVDRALDAIVKRLREPGEPDPEASATPEADGAAMPRA